MRGRKALGALVWSTPLASCLAVITLLLACVAASAETVNKDPVRSPSTVATDTAQYADIAAGDSHTCGITTAGNVECWGWNRYGESSPPSGAFSSVSVSMGSDWRNKHSCGIRTSGAIDCWGDNYYGQSSPPVGNFIAVSAGAAHTCAVRVGGSLTCWGENSRGQSNAPEGDFASVSAGTHYTCGLKTNGTIVCWVDDDDWGQASPPPGEFTAMSAGSGHTCGIRADGTVECWGLETSAPSGSFSSVDAGTNHTCGIRISGTVECWGDDYSGQSTPPAGDFTVASSGNYYSCGVRVTGSIECWGKDSYQFGPANPSYQRIMVPFDARIRVTIEHDADQVAHRLRIYRPVEMGWSTENDPRFKPGTAVCDDWRHRVDQDNSPPRCKAGLRTIAGTFVAGAEIRLVLDSTNSSTPIVSPSSNAYSYRLSDSTWRIRFEDCDECEKDHEDVSVLIEATPFSASENCGGAFRAFSWELKGSTRIAPSKQEVLHHGAVWMSRKVCGAKFKIIAQKKECGWFGCNYVDKTKSSWIPVDGQGGTTTFATSAQPCKSGTHRYRTRIVFQTPYGGADEEPAGLTRDGYVQPAGNEYTC